VLASALRRFYSHVAWQKAMLLDVTHSETGAAPGSPALPRTAVFVARARSAVNYITWIFNFVWTNPANERARLRAMIRLARFQARGRVLHKRTLVRLGDRSTLWADLHRWEASKVAYGNLPDYAEMNAWRQVIRPGDLFVDVGANVGSYSIWAGELGAEVIALEPAEDTFAVLEENVALNGYTVEMIRAAAGDTCGKARFTSGLDCVNRFDPSGRVETVVVTIDSIVGDRFVTGLKIDVEGFEMQVLRGCVSALSEHRIGLIQLEWNATSMTAVGADRRPIADFLGDYGYNLYRPDRDGTLFPLTNVDFGRDVFARPSRRRLLEDQEPAVASALSVDNPKETDTDPRPRSNS